MNLSVGKGKGDEGRGYRFDMCFRLLVRPSCLRVCMYICMYIGGRIAKKIDSHSEEDGVDEWSIIFFAGYKQMPRGNGIPPRLMLDWC